MKIAKLLVASILILPFLFLNVVPTFAQSQPAEKTTTEEPKEYLKAEDLPTEYVMPEEMGIKRIAFLYDGPSEFFNTVISAVKKEIEALTAHKIDVEFVSTENGNWDKATIKRKLDKLLADDNVDIIIGSGLFTGLAAVQKKTLSKPVILADFYDIDFWDMPYKDDTSGVSNLTYVGLKGKVANDLKWFHKIVPFKKVHILVDGAYLDEVKDSKRKGKGVGYEIVCVPYKKTASQTINGLTSQTVEAVYLTYSSTISDKEYLKLINKLNENRYPTFSMSGRRDVENGVLAGLTPKVLTKFARRVALNAYKVFHGTNPEDLAVLFEMEEMLIINARTARQIGVSIPFNVLLAAEVLHSDESYGEELTIKTAVNEATANNLLFRIRDEEIEEARQNHAIFWSGYLPQIIYGLNFDRFNGRTAKNSGGIVPERLFDYRFTLNQLIFSDPIITDIINSKKEVKVTELQKDTSTLDITDETAIVYLEYLIAKALLKVEEENLKTNRHQLKVAKRRLETGVGGKDEVLRWEAEVAQSQSDVLLKTSDVRNVRVTLNQLMNHPQEEPFAEQDANLELVSSYLGSSYLDPYINNMDNYVRFIDFMVSKAFVNSPEIAALNISIEQQMNIKNTAIKKFFLPEMRLSGHNNYRIDRKDHATTSNNDRDEWFLGLDLEIPVFQGGERIFDLMKQQAGLRGLVFKRDLKMQQVELDVRRSAYDMFHSYPNIDLAKTAMVSATGNFEIVQEKYAQGTASITDLIIAQNFKFQQEANAVVAVYQFLQDLSSFDRAIAKYYFLASDAEKQTLLDEIKVYFEGT